MQSVLPLLLSEVEEAIYGYSVEKMVKNLFGYDKNVIVYALRIHLIDWNVPSVIKRGTPAPISTFIKIEPCRKY